MILVLPPRTRSNCLKASEGTASTPVDYLFGMWSSLVHWILSRRWNYNNYIVCKSKILHSQFTLQSCMGSAWCRQNNCRHWSRLTNKNVRFFAPKIRVLTHLEIFSAKVKLYGGIFFRNSRFLGFSSSDCILIFSAFWIFLKKLSSSDNSSFILFL